MLGLTSEGLVSENPAGKTSTWPHGQPALVGMATHHLRREAGSSGPSLRHPLAERLPGYVLGMHHG